MRASLSTGFVLAVMAAGVSARAQSLGYAGDRRDNGEMAAPDDNLPTAEDEAAIVPPLTPSFGGAGRAAPLVYAGVEGGWEGARRAGVFESNVEAAIVGPLSIRAGAATMSSSDGKAHPALALKADLLRQSAHGIDGAIFGGYRGQGFNLVPAIELGVAIGRRTGRVAWGASATYGQGTQQGERYGDVRAAGLTRVTRRLDVRVGLDARARFDLEYDGDEPTGEAGFDGTAGPLLAWSVGRFVISGQAGLGALSLRSGGSARVGAVSRLGVGAVF